MMITIVMIVIAMLLQPGIMKVMIMNMISNDIQIASIMVNKMMMTR